MGADAICAPGKACQVEKLFGARGIEGILRDVQFVGPVIRRKNAAGGLRLAVEQVSDERGAICGEGQSLADFSVS